MKKASIALVLILAVMLVAGMACGSNGNIEPTPTPTPTSTPTSTLELTPTSIEVIKPTVGNIPQGWYFSHEEPYGTYEESDGTEWGFIEYNDTEDDDFVQIFYGDVPAELEGRETDSDALIGKAIEWSIMSELDETGTMVVAGQTAGYTKTYGSAGEYNEMEIVFIVESTCFDIYTAYDATTEDEAQAMSIMNSISIK